MILDIFYLVGFVVFKVYLVIIWVYWIAYISLNSTNIFYFKYIKIMINFFICIYVGCCLRYVNIFEEDYV